MSDTDSPAPAHAGRPLLNFVGVLALIALGGVIFFAVNSLASGGRTPAASEAGLAPIHRAAADGDAAAVARLIARGVDLEATIKGGPIATEGMTPLLLAAYKGNAEVVRALIDADARLEARTADGRTPLIYAAGWGSAETVAALIEAGARVDARADAGMTALMFAAAPRPDVAVLSALIDAGADVNARNKWRQDPLMIAARAGALDKVERLLASGADATSTDLNEETALSLAAETADIDSLVLETLLRAGADADAANIEGVTPLMKAAQMGRADLVALLLEAGASRDAADANGWTAAAWARNRQDELGQQIARMLAGHD